MPVSLSRVGNGAGGSSFGVGSSVYRPPAWSTISSSPSGSRPKPTICKRESASSCPTEQSSSRRAAPPRLARRIVAVDVGAVEVGVFLAVVDDAAGQRAELGMVVLDGRHDDRVGAAFALRLERVAALHDAPAGVVALVDDVRLLPQVLAVLADPECAGLAGRTSSATGCGSRRPTSPGAVPLRSTKGLSFGTEYALPSAGWSTSMRSTLAVRCASSWPRRSPSESLVPSPEVT